MAHIRETLAVAALVFIVRPYGFPFAAGGTSEAHQAGATPTVASVVDREVADVEKQVVDAGEAMPEAKFDFSPASLAISGAEYNGVRTFANELKHIAASNYAIWAPLTGEQFPADYKGGDGPKNIAAKADIIAFVKASFALGHRAAATLTPASLLEPVGTGRSPRLHLAEFGVAHAYDHYGQIVEYLRMNGIVPPASR